MMEFIGANMAPIMFLSLIVFLLFGYSVAFSLGACGLFFGVIGVEMGLMPQTLLQALPLRIFGIMQNDTLLAIPFFTFMGLILERSGMAEDLLDTIGQLFGPDPRRPGDRGDPGRRDARGDHRCRRRIGDLDGPDLAADHAALRL
jgi:GntP family gluconate:H+ symporter